MPTGLRSSNLNDQYTAILPSQDEFQIALGGRPQIVTDQLELGLNLAGLKAQSSSPAEIPAG
ncbi:MAG: hypothetical protein ACKON8_04755, partial [Planctomycetota bacterium]